MHQIFDTGIPNIARIHDAMLGGKDNVAADRDAADRLTEVEPLAPLYARQHREFIGRAVRLVAGSADPHRGRRTARLHAARPTG